MNNYKPYNEYSGRRMEIVDIDDLPYEPSLRVREPLWKKYAINLANAPEEPLPIILHNNILVCSRSNITAIIGKPKSKKTFLCIAMTGGVLKKEGYLGFSDGENSNGKILWIDTEQSPFHVSQVAKKIHKIVGLPCETSAENLIVLSIRGEKPDMRYNILENAIKNIKPDLVIVDGVSDLLANTNDIEESERLVSNLLSLTLQYDNHIIGVLHTNPYSDKARGHLGSTLERKTETMILVEADGNITKVKPKFSRNIEFEEFYFTINEDGLPCEIENPTKQTLSTTTFKAIMENDKCYSCKELKTLIMEKDEGTKEGAAMQRITRGVTNGYIIKNDFGKYHLPDYENEIEENDCELSK